MLVNLDQKIVLCLTIVGQKLFCRCFLGGGDTLAPFCGFCCSNDNQRKLLVEVCQLLESLAL